MIKVATWNVNSLRVRLPLLQRFVTTYQPDVLCLQETKLPDEQFPVDGLRDMGFPHLAFQGQRAYNGVAILSKLPLTDIVRGFSSEEPDEQPRLLRATTAGIRIWSCYVPNGQAVGSDKFAYKLAWLAALTAWLKDELARHPRLVLAGDFNIAPEDRDAHPDWKEEIHVSVAGR